MNPTIKIFLVVLLASTANLKAVDLLLTPIDLRITIDPSDWGIVRKDAPQMPAQTEIQPHDKADGFSFQLISDGKARYLFIRTVAVKSDATINSETDRIAAIFKGEGLDLNAPEASKSTTKFLGVDCYKVAVGIPSRPSQISSPKGYLLYYLFCAHGLLYVITAQVEGANPPDNDPVMKDLFDSISFISNPKSVGQSPAQPPPAPAVKPRSESDLKSTIASFIEILKNGDYFTMMENYLAAGTTEKMGPHQEAAFVKLSGTPETKKAMEHMLAVMQSIKDATPVYNDKGDEAVFKDVKFPSGQTSDVRFNKINAFWYLDSASYSAFRPTQSRLMLPIP